MLKISSLNYTYNQNTPFSTQALQEVSFSIAEGEVVGLIGPSGSGKSSLLRCLTGVLQLTNGKVLWKGENKNNSSVKMGLVIQEPEQQFFLDNIFEEVSFALSDKNYTPEEIKYRVDIALNLVGFNGNVKDSPFRLSGGQQRRVAIASILIMDPDVLLLDEPTVGLDASGLTMIDGLVRKFQNEQKIVVLTSHDIDYLYDLASRFLVLTGGKLIADFPKSDFLKHGALLKKLGIGIPEKVWLEERGFFVGKMEDKT